MKQHRVIFEIDNKLYPVYSNILVKNSKYFKTLFEDRNIDEHEVIKLQYLKPIDENIWLMFFNIVHNNVIKTNDKQYYKLYEMSNYFMYDGFNNMLQLEFQLDSNLKHLIDIESDTDSDIDICKDPCVNNCVDRLNFLEQNPNDKLNINDFISDKNYNPDKIIALYDYCSKSNLMDKFKSIFQSGDLYINNNYAHLVKIAGDNFKLVHILSLNFEISKYKDNFLLHDVFKYRHYTRYTKPKQEIKYTSFFSLPFKNEEHTIVESIDIFKNNLLDMSFGIINDNFIWKNVVLSGGAVLQCLSLKSNVNIDAGSDIDLWIYGETKEKRIETSKNILQYFSTISDAVYYSVNGSVVTIIAQGIKRNFQIILTSHETKYDIINNFDMDYIQCLYDGCSVYGLFSFFEAMKTQITTINNSNNIHRIIKAYEKGFSFTSDDKCEILDQYDALYKSNEKKITKYKNKYFYFDKDDDFERMSFLIKTIMMSKCVYKSIDELFDNFDFNVEFDMSKYDSDVDINNFDWSSIVIDYESIKNQQKIILKLTEPLKIKISNLFIPIDYDRNYKDVYSSNRLLTNLSTGSEQIINFFDKLHEIIQKQINTFDSKIVELIKETNHSYNCKSDNIIFQPFYSKREQYNKPTEQYLKLNLKIKEHTKIVDIYGDKIDIIPNNVTCDAFIIIDKFYGLAHNMCASTVYADKIIVNPYNYRHNKNVLIDLD